MSRSPFQSFDTAELMIYGMPGMQHMRTMIFFDLALTTKFDLIAVICQFHLTGAKRREFWGMIHFITSNVIIPATPIPIHPLLSTGKLIMEHPVTMDDLGVRPF